MVQVVAENLLSCYWTSCLKEMMCTAVYANKINITNFNG